MPVNIVLVEPEIPQNTGNIIRTCACTGSILHLVKPLGFSMSEKHLKRAGLDYSDLVDIRYYDSFSELYTWAGNQNHPEVNKRNFYFFTTKTKKNYSDIQYEEDSFLVFGPETRGLTKEIRDLIPENNVRIPMLNMDRVRSLNLSNSVAIAVYEVVRQQQFSFLC